MELDEVLDSIIDNLQAEDVPASFMIMAKLTDLNGNEKIIKGSDLEDFLKNNKKEFYEVRFVLNVKKMKLAILNEFKKFKERLDE
jgi:hypothetical protein